MLCSGFTKQIVELLNSLQADYETFDILTDDAVLEGLKEYSNWPTYPQLYIKGELIGGIDKSRELAGKGELQAKLPKKTDINERYSNSSNAH